VIHLRLALSRIELIGVRVGVPATPPSESSDRSSPKIVLKSNPASDTDST